MAKADASIVYGLDLCAGIGGLSLGVAGALPTYRTVCYVEREAFCASVLASRMARGALDDAPIWSDVATFRGKPWRGCVNVVTAGYPCQPFSAAGRRRGADDPRHIWPHIARIVDEVRPATVFCENVPGHVSLGLRDVCADLRELGYDVQAGVFSAAQCGAPHIRKRLFLLAHAHGGGLRAQRGRGQPRARAPVAAEHGVPQPVANAHGQGQPQQGWPVGALGRRPRDGGSDLADADGHGCQQRQSAPALQQRRQRPDGSDWWAVEPDVDRMAHGVPHRVDRLRALGNAVVPMTATLAFVTLSAWHERDACR